MYFKWNFVFKNEILKIFFKEYLLMSARTMTALNRCFENRFLVNK